MSLETATFNLSADSA